MTDFTILVVEDDRALRELIRIKLSQVYEVRTAVDGIKALEAVEKEVPDLIISDIMMPRMDGFTFQERLQENPETRTIPFIFLTARTDEESKREGLDRGIDDYITKPFDFDRLRSRVNQLLKRVRLYQNQLQARVGRDFSQQLMPQTVPECEGYRFRFHYAPREEGGGDIFDWTVLDKGKETYLLTVGDVMGKGLKAKFYAHSFLSYVRSALRVMNIPDPSPADILERVNQMILSDKVLAGTFVTLVLVRWEAQAHRIICANAGHCHPIRFSNGEAHLVPADGPVLGMKETGYENTSFTLSSSEGLILYTDALIELNPDHDPKRGEQEMIELVPQAASSEQPVEALLDLVRKQASAEEFRDDVLVVWLERNR